mgnify:CR=1 FL=1
MNVVRVDALAVIRDADQLRPALEDVDIDAGGEGIDAVFQQLLHDVGGSLNDLARRDLVDNALVQLLNSGHGIASVCSSIRSGFRRRCLPWRAEF